MVFLFRLSLCFFSFHSFAQEVSDVVDVTNGDISTSKTLTTQDFKAQESKRSNVEKIEVTGSRIKRIDVEGPSPVLTLDKEYLEKSGYNSVSDVLRDSTVSSFGVEREDSDETNSIGAGTIGLRGLGADRTLVLLDGRRLPKLDGGNSVDLNLIPFAAIERVEILKDGASAVYGSDALAGVINFVTKKDFDGANVKMRYSLPEAKGGARQEVSASYGKNFSKGNFLAVYSYRNNERVMDSDRPWSKGALSSYGSPGSTRQADDTSKWQAASNCPEERIIRNSDGSSYCGFDYSVYTSGLPDTEQHSAMLRGEYELTGSTDVFAVSTYTRRQVRWQWAPSPDDFNDKRAVGGSNYTIPELAVQNGGLGTASGDYELRYRTVNELGPRSNRDTTNSLGAVVGVRGEMLDTWDWETSVNYGQSKLYNSRHAGYGNTKKIFEAILSGEVRPFDSSATPSANPSLHHAGEQTIRTNVTTAQFVASGELGQALGGSFVMATGVSTAQEGYQIEVDDVTASGDLFGGIGEQGQGDRSYQSVFSELGFLWGPLEVQLAGRFDNYSDFGSTVNPKLAIRYAPLRSLVFRGSAGTGFRAPSLDELYSSSGYKYPWFTDTQACATVGGTFCEEQQYRVFSGGNRNLEEETSVSFNIGTVIQPTQNFSVSVDYWGTKVENAVGLDLNDLMFAESVLGNSKLKDYGVNVIRRDGLITEIIAPNVNLASQESEGLEFAASYVMKIGAVTLRPRMDHSQLLKSVEEVFPGLGFRSKLDERGRPKWKNNISMAMGLYNHGLRMAARTVAGQFKGAHLVDPTDTRRLPTYTEYDAHYSYLAGFGGEFSFGVKNLLNSNRPLDDSAGFSNRFNGQLYDQIGRLYYMGYSHTF